MSSLGRPSPRQTGITPFLTKSTSPRESSDKRGQKLVSEKKEGTRRAQRTVQKHGLKLKSEIEPIEIGHDATALQHEIQCALAVMSDMIKQANDYGVKPRLRAVVKLVEKAIYDGVLSADSEHLVNVLEYMKNVRKGPAKSWFGVLATARLVQEIHLLQVHNAPRRGIKVDGLYSDRLHPVECDSKGFMCLPDLPKEKKKTLSSTPPMRRGSTQRLKERIDPTVAVRAKELQREIASEGATYELLEPIEHREARILLFKAQRRHEAVTLTVSVLDKIKAAKKDMTLQNLAKVNMELERALDCCDVFANKRIVELHMKLEEIVLSPRRHDASELLGEIEDVLLGIIKNL